MRVQTAVACLLLVVGCTKEPSPAAARAAEVVALINTGDRDRAREYIDGHYSDLYRDLLPTARHLGMLSQLHTEDGRLRVERVAEPAKEKATVLAQGALSERWMEIDVAVEPKPPHRITALDFRLAPAPAGKGAPLARTDEERAKALEEYVGRMAAADAFSGVVLLTKDGRPIFARAYGDANREAGRRNTLETAFNLASVNKMITAVAVAQLAEAGKLSFDDPLAKFIPDFPTPRASQEIRIKHLLSHTAGMGSFLGGGISGSRAATIDEMLKFAKEADPAFPAGTRWDYSNTGFLVLGKVIERASGQSYYDYVREHIHVPAGMRSTASHPKDRIPPTAAIGYDREYEDGPGAYSSHVPELPYRGGPSGGGYSTAGDLLRFAEALRTGKLVSPAMVRVLTTPKPELSSPEYGYGFTADRPGIAGHSGGYVGTSTNVDLFLEDGYTAIMLSNYGQSGMPVVERMRELVRGPQPVR